MTAAAHHRAVVIGAGMAGLMSAAVLSKYFRSVVVVEPDELPGLPAPRKATPQCVHVHALLKSGEGVLSELFPGFKAELRDAGGHEFAVRSQWRTWGSNGWIEPIDIGLTMLSQTRVMLEHLVRSRSLSEPAVDRVRGKVLELRTDRHLGVEGVEIDSATGPSFIPADLVLDASGRGGKTLAWLDALGVSLPPEERIAPELHYTSALFTRGTSSGPDLGGWLMFPQAPETRGAVALPVENAMWTVTAFDRFGRRAPDDEEGFRAFLAELPDPKFSELLAAERPVGSFRSYRIADVRLRRFDQIVDALPHGYLPIGDAVATFNPIYAQGMSVAALQARALDMALHECGSDRRRRSEIGARYLPAAIEPAMWAWRLGEVADLRYEQVAGVRTEATAAFATTVQEVLKRSSTDPSLMAAYGKVVHLLVSPDSLAAALEVRR